MPARVHASSSAPQRAWHPIVENLCDIVLTELKFCDQLFKTPQGATKLLQDWAVDIVWHGADKVRDWWVTDEEKSAAADKRAAAFRRRIQRISDSEGITALIGGPRPASDLYFAVVAVLIERKQVTKWVRRRDTIGKLKADINRGLTSGRDPFWIEKLYASPLGGSGIVDMDPHSGLTVISQVEILRRVCFEGPDCLPFFDWTVHRNAHVMRKVVGKLDGILAGKHRQAWIVIMVAIACGKITTDDGILSDKRLQGLLHGSERIPNGAGGLTLEQYEVLGALRDGARMQRDWPPREYRDITPTDSQYRVTDVQTTTEWKLKSRWKSLTFGQREYRYLVWNILMRMEQPRGSAALKPAVLPAMVCAVADVHAKAGRLSCSSGCLDGRLERKSAHCFTDSEAALTAPVQECQATHPGDQRSDSCSSPLPPLKRHPFAHVADVAKRRPKQNRLTEDLHFVGPQPQIALVIAEHEITTSLQRARMVNVDICAGSQSQRKAMLLLNVYTESFDNREYVDTQGTWMVNSVIDATKDDLYESLASVLHAKGIAMARIAIATLSSDCQSTSTASAHLYRTSDGVPKPGSAGLKARTADRVMYQFLRLVKRLRAERAELKRIVLAMLER